MIAFNNSHFKWLAIASLNLGLVAGVIAIKAHPNELTHNAEAISNRLTDIQTQLITIREEVKKPGERVDLSSIKQDFNKLTALIEQIKTKDENQLNQLLNDNRNELSQKLDAIHQGINTLDKKQNPIKYFPATALPFKILSIDSIQQVNVASVVYDYKTFPLEKGEILVGWTVLHIDFSKQRIELENNEKERVVVTLESDEGEQHA